MLRRRSANPRLQPTRLRAPLSRKPFGEQVKPPLHRYLLAHTAGASAATGIIGALTLMLVGLHSEGALIPRVEVSIWVALAAVPVAAIGWMVGICFLWRIVLAPIAARLQGWPFAIGDQVWILSGRHKNTSTTIYAVWEERGQVRVELGPEAKDNVEDVYCAVAVCRTEPTAAPDCGPGKAASGLGVGEGCNR
jgi:hypothetical protein